MQKRIFLFVFISLVLTSMVSATPSLYTSDSDCINKNTYEINNSVYAVADNFGTNIHQWYIIGKDNSCDPSRIIASGFFFIEYNPQKYCFKAFDTTDDNCGEYQLIVGDLMFGDQIYNFYINNTKIIAPIVPEFSNSIVLTLTIIGALAVFFLMKER